MINNFNNSLKCLIAFLSSLIFYLLTCGIVLAQNEDLSVIKGWLEYSNRENALYRHLTDQGLDYLKKRAADVAKLSTKEDWLKRQEHVRNILMDIVGPFPEKTPLNARVVGTLNKNGFKIEKIIFESRPNFYVTAGLFIPETNMDEKKPAVVYCSGHSNIAFRNLAYQTVILNLVKKGFIVFAFDPIGQGERLLYFDPEFGESRIGGPTLEHSYPGAQCFLIGSSCARHMIWDGIRAIDYLITREEVDAKRIGITGRSGGGTQSSYIAAFDERVWAAAPECYITSFNRLIESRGPQDAEQNFYHGWANGIDHADLLEVRAPKPGLLIATTRDFFSIQGVRETSEEIKKVYRVFGKEENYYHIEDDAPHASTQNNRERMYAFFQKHLNLPGNSKDEQVEFLTSEELKITKTGQVSTSLAGETVFSLNHKEAKVPIEKVIDSRKDTQNHLKKVRSEATRLSGYIQPKIKGSAVFTGRYKRGGYSIEKYFIEGEGEYVIPFLLLVPDEKGNHPALIYLNPAGKSSDSDPGGVMEWLVKKGYVVLAPDLLGYGEMGPGIFKGDAYNFKPGKAFYNIWFASIQLARSLVGVRAGDVIRLSDFLKSREDIDLNSICAMAKGEMCPVLLHAACFDNTIHKIALMEPLISYRSLVLNQYYKPSFIPVSVAGSLNAYDLPDLCATLAPRQLLMVDVFDHIGKPVQNELLQEEFDFVKTLYKSLAAEQKFQIRTRELFHTLDDIFADWLAQE